VENEVEIVRETLVAVRVHCHTSGDQVGNLGFAQRSPDRLQRAQLHG